MPETDTSDKQSATGNLILPSLDLIYNSIKDRIADQRVWADALDTKSGAVIAAASVVMGLAVAFQAAVSIAPGPSASHREVRAILIVLQFITYCVTSGIAYKSFAVRKHDYAPTPTELWTYVRNDEQFTKARLTVAMKAVHEENAKQIEEKARWLRYSLWAFIAQVAVLGVTAFVEILVS